jgi:hypothetical protein
LEHDEIIAPDIIKFIYKRLKFLRTKILLVVDAILILLILLIFPNIGKK